MYYLYTCNTGEVSKRLTKNVKSIMFLKKVLTHVMIAEMYTTVSTPNELFN